MLVIPGLDPADLLVVNWDLTNFGDKTDAKMMLNEILSVYDEIGNLDNYDINTYLDELNLNLHENEGTDSIGNTQTIPPGMLHHGGWIVIRLIKSTITAILQ